MGVQRCAPLCLAIGPERVKIEGREAAAARRTGPSLLDPACFSCPAGYRVSTGGYLVIQAPMLRLEGPLRLAKNKSEQK